MAKSALTRLGVSAFFAVNAVALDATLVCGRRPESGLTSLPFTRDAWEKYQPLGGEFEEGHYTQRHDRAPCFELSRIVAPSSNIVVEATITPERIASGAASATAGIVIWEGHFRYRRMGLTFRHDGKRSFELIELRDGARMPESDMPATPAGRTWEFGEPVTLRISLGDGKVKGEASAADGTILFQRTLPIKPGAVASGIPGFSQYCLHVRHGTFGVKTGERLPDNRDEARVYRKWADVTDANSVETNAFYRTRRDNAGKWLFIDPSEKPMFLSGIGVVNYRGHYSAALGYAPYARTVSKKYPSLEDWATNTLARLQDWGFNFLSSPSENLLRRGFPHAHVANHGIGQEFACYGDEYDILPCDGGPCSGFPNVFHPLWREYCRFAARAFCRTEREDPWLLGWYTDNELSWWGDKRQFKTPPESGLFDAAARKGDAHPAKQALRALLAERGYTGEASSAPVELKREFVRLCARKYFEATTAAIREADPNHLILGCRFAGLPSADPVVWEECGRYCDAVSVNIYPMVDLDRGVAVDWPGPNARLMSDIIGERARIAGKPVIVTEWGFSALDSGLPCTHGAGQRFFTQKERAAATSIFARTLWAMPEVAGYVYFMWCDQPAVGKSGPQSENTNYGLVNADDEPYKEQVAALSELQNDPVRSRMSAVPQTQEVVPPQAEDFVNASAFVFDDNLKINAAKKAAFFKASEYAQPRLSIENSALIVAGKGRFSAMLREYTKGHIEWTAAEEVLAQATAKEGVREVCFQGEAASGAFEVRMRFFEPANAPFFAVELLSIRNCGRRPLPFDSVFFRFMPVEFEGVAAARGDDVFEPPQDGQPTPIPPKLWRPWRSGAWILQDGTVLGLLSPRKTGVQIRFWKDDSFHSDAEIRYPLRNLAPGEEWEPDNNPFVIGGVTGGGEAGWRSFCNAIRMVPASTDRSRLSPNFVSKRRLKDQQR